MFGLDDYIIVRKRELQVHWAEKKKTVNGQLTSTIVSFRTFDHDCWSFEQHIHCKNDITVAVYRMKSRTGVTQMHKGNISS